MEIIAKTGNSMYVPKGDTYLRTGDILNVFGTDTALMNIRQKMR